MFIGIPTVTEREKILSCLTENLPIDSSVNLLEIAMATKGYVGADLAHLCREAAYVKMLCEYDRFKPVGFLDTLCDSISLDDVLIGSSLVNFIK